GGAAAGRVADARGTGWGGRVREGGRGQWRALVAEAGRWSLVLAAAWHTVPNAPPAAFCPGNAAPQVLAVGEYAALQPVDGCVVFPANGSPDTAEYLLVPQATTGSPDLSTS